MPSLVQVDGEKELGRLEWNIVCMCNVVWCLFIGFAWKMAKNLLRYLRNLLYTYASEMTYIVSGGALNSTHSFTSFQLKFDQFPYVYTIQPL